VFVSTKILKPTELYHKLYLWNQANIDEIKLKFASLGKEFTEHHTTDMPVEDLWESLCSILKLVLDEFVPSKMTKGTSKKPWINRKVRQLWRRNRNSTT